MVSCSGLSSSLTSGSGIVPFVGAFGEAIIAQETAEVQLAFPYNINTDYVSTTLTGSGTVTQASSLANINSGAASSSSALMNSIRTIHYPSGQGVEARFTAVYATPASGNNQFAGIGNSDDGFFFGYNGTSFGVMHRSFASDTWIPQTTWNGDKFDGTGDSDVTLNAQRGNVYMIQFQWLGFGNIKFFIENPNTGHFVQVHEIKYANNNLVPSLKNPNLSMMAQSINTSNTSNITLKVGSMGAFVEGKIQNIDNRQSFANSKTGILTEVNIFTLRNNSTFAGTTNRSKIIVDFLNFLNRSTQEGQFFLTLNATLGGAPAFTNINANTSIAATDTAGTTVTGGKRLMSLYLAANASESLNFEPYRINLFPGQTLTCSALTLGINLSLGISLSWIERL